MFIIILLFILVEENKNHSAALPRLNVFKQCKLKQPEVFIEMKR